MIRAAIADAATPATIERGRDPRAGDPDLFAARVESLGARVTRVAAELEVAPAIESILARNGVMRIAVPDGLPSAWLPRGTELVVDDPPLPHAELAALDGALTGSAMAIAQTGTLVLSGSEIEGRRALSLLPDLHVCVVRAKTIVADVASAVAAIACPSAPITFVSGPSATSDIELERVEGVHGPRQLEVVLVGEGHG
jgi:L-lactate dehydrogenase complex protein LldG